MEIENWMDLMHEFDLPSRDLVLVGAGHTNLHIVRQWRMRPIPDVRLTLVTPFSRATYSGMLPGTLAGAYRPDEMKIDLYRFTAGTGIRLIVAEATGLKPDARVITFNNRPPVRFDVASIGIGSVPNQPELWKNSPHVLSIKPMATFFDRLSDAVVQFLVHRTGEKPIRFVVVGSGAAGTEVALCLDAKMRTSFISYEVTLLDHHAEILTGYVPAMVQRARQLMEERGIAVCLGRRASQIEETAGADVRLILDDGTVLSADLIIWSTSACPPDVLAGYDLPKAADGFLAVQSTLKTTADAPVFAVGDSASFVNAPVPKAGVYAVREGPILWENLRRHLSGRTLISFQPQRGFLSLLATGDGHALMQYKGWVMYGKLAWRLKDHIDRKFIRMYQDYEPPAMRSTSNWSWITNPKSSREKMHCGGCGCKVGANLLTTVLKRIRELAPETAVALDQPEDAFVIPSTVPRSEVVSVDFFRAFLDDPYLMGRIAVLHALSDLWAMGALPTGVQAMLTLPYGPPEQQSELLFQILAGTVRELKTHEVSLWGGHTIEGPELQLGFSAVGHLSGRRPWRKSGLRVKDVLILTKPLGTGVLLAAHQRGKCRAEWMDAALQGMLQSQSKSAEIARGFPIQAATDVTGFGLAGHLLEMLRASSCSAELEFSSQPDLLLPGVMEMLEQGVESTLAPANKELESSIIATPDQRQSPTFSALFDPQTSGGLLLAVSPEIAPDLITALGTTVEAKIIGQVLPQRKSQATILYR